MMRSLINGLVFTAILSVLISTYVLWDDGRRVAATDAPYRPAPQGIDNPSYLDGDQFDWQSPAALQRYRQTSRTQILTELNRYQTP